MPSTYIEENSYTANKNNYRRIIVNNICILIISIILIYDKSIWQRINVFVCNAGVSLQLTTTDD